MRVVVIRPDYKHMSYGNVVATTCSPLQQYAKVDKLERLSLKIFILLT